MVDMVKKYAWVSPEVLTWDRFVSKWSTHDEVEWKRSYAHWQHADQLLPGANDELRRVDIIAALKRAVDFRVKLLHSRWRLRDIPLPGRPRTSLERLELLGIARPHMVQRLVMLRNAIEHEDAHPPDTGTCRDLVEFVWYFLRSTDALVSKTTDSVELHPEPNHSVLGGTMYGGPEQDWILTVSLRLNDPLIAFHEKKGWITVALRYDTTAHIRGLPQEMRKNLEEQLAGTRNIWDEEDQTFALYGNIVGPFDQQLRAVQLLLEPF